MRVHAPIAGDVRDPLCGPGAVGQPVAGPGQTVNCPDCRTALNHARHAYAGGMSSSYTLAPDVGLREFLRGEDL